MSVASISHVRDSYDVVVVGGGPAGATLAALLARHELRVAIFEREQFPRFHIGESLLPANLPLFDRLGCHDLVRRAGFLTKPGATFYDEYEGRGSSSFTFEETPFQPAFAYNVVRAEFDLLLLQHAANMGAVVHQPYTVDKVYIDAEKVLTQVCDAHGREYETCSAMLVDASGQAAFLGRRLGKRQALVNLGRVALFAHFRGVRKDETAPEGNIRIHLVRDGWLWAIPFADGTHSIGCVLHSNVAKQRQGSITTLFETATASAPSLAKRLEGAQRLTPVRSAANFSYSMSPAVGNRYLAVGDAAGFVDPIFSTGVYLAMHAAEKAADVIRQAFHYQDFRANRFKPYEAHLRRVRKPILGFIRRFYDPSFLDLFFAPSPPPHLYRAVLWVLSGAICDYRPLWVRSSLWFFFAINTLQKIRRWATGLPLASRWHW